MNGWDAARALVPVLRRGVAMVVAGSVLAWMVVTGDFTLVWAAMASGVNTVAQWLGFYEALTRVVTP